MNQQESEQEFQTIQQERLDVISWLHQQLDKHVQGKDGASATESIKIDVPPTVQTVLLGEDQPVGGFEIRPLVQEELAILKDNGCSWKHNPETRISWLLPSSVTLDETMKCLAQSVSHTHMAGFVVLGYPKASSSGSNNGTISFSSEHELLDPGLHHNTVVANCLIHLDAWVYNNRCLSHTCVASHASILGCARVMTTSEWSPNNVITITVGPESAGGRDISVTPQETMISVARQIMHPPTNTSDSTTNNSPNTCWNIVSCGASIRDCTNIHAVYLHADAHLVGASSVEESVLFPSASIGLGCTVERCFLQWKSSIQDHSHVENALLMETCHVGPHSKIGDSVLGPDVALGSGEVQSCVIGPNTAAHHQSLLIGMIWLLGRGNVGYGANVGSNHTGRAPDQEALSGEGLFWGLSTVIVYPVNLSRAPYSIVAAGTKLTPCSISMPFSLIVDKEIVPGWVLRSTPYTLARGEQKIATRRKALRHHYYTGWPMLEREEVLLQVFQARQILEDIKREGFDSYNSRGEIVDLGRCILSESNRRKAIDTYTSFLQKSALMGLLSYLENEKSNGVSDIANREKLFEENESFDIKNPSWYEMPWEAQDLAAKTWKFQLFILVNEFGPSDTWDLRHLLETTLVSLAKSYANAVKTCKQRDDLRGAQVIPDYALSHSPAEEHAVVSLVENEVSAVEDRVKALLAL